MEPRDRMLLEAVIGVIFIVFLVLASVMVVSAYKNPETATKTTIINSYNTNSFNTYPSQTTHSQTAPRVYTTQYTTSSYPSPRYSGSSYYANYPSRTSAKPYLVDRGDYSRVYYTEDSSGYKDTKTYSDDRYLGYDDFGNFRVYSGIVGNRVDNYEVYVRNREYVGGYFKTIFYFKDYYGNVDSESMTHYIPAKEEKSFVLKDISPPRYKYRTWWYEVEPLTKVPTRVYYNDNGRYVRTYSGDSQSETYLYGSN